MSSGSSRLKFLARCAANSREAGPSWVIRRSYALFLLFALAAVRPSLRECP